MPIDTINTADAEALAPILLAGLQRLGHLGRDAAAALAALVKDEDAEFDEAAYWIASIAAGDHL